MMTGFDRWKRYAKTIQCDGCGDRLHDRDDGTDDADADEELGWVVLGAWDWYGFTHETAPEPSRAYLPTTCEGCRHFQDDPR